MQAPAGQGTGDRGTRLDLDTRPVVDSLPGAGFRRSLSLGNLSHRGRDVTRALVHFINRGTLERSPNIRL